MASKLCKLQLKIKVSEYTNLYNKTKEKIVKLTVCIKIKAVISFYNNFTFKNKKYKNQKTITTQKNI